MIRLWSLRLDDDGMRELGLGIDARRQLHEVTNDFRGHDFTRLDLRFGPHFPPQSLPIKTKPSELIGSCLSTAGSTSRAPT